MKLKQQAKTFLHVAIEPTDMQRLRKVAHEEYLTVSALVRRLIFKHALNDKTK